MSLDWYSDAIDHEAQLAEWRGKAALKWPELEGFVDLIQSDSESGFMETAADVARRVKGGGAPAAPAAQPAAPAAIHNHAGVPTPAGWDGGPSSASILDAVRKGERERGGVAAQDWMAAKMAETYGDGS